MKQRGTLKGNGRVWEGYALDGEFFFYAHIHSCQIDLLKFLGFTFEAEEKITVTKEQFERALSMATDRNGIFLGHGIWAELVKEAGKNDE